MISKNRYLVLGTSGLMGFTLSLFLSKQPTIEVYGTYRSDSLKIKNLKLLKVNNLTEIKNLDKIIKKVRPKFIINCLSTNHVSSKLVDIIDIFALIPRFLNDLSFKYNFKLINLSSDIVYGSKFNYYSKESDSPCLMNEYAVCKYLGEINSKNIINIRTSIYGHSFKYKKGLLDWFLLKKKCSIYTNYFFSGISNLELSKIIFSITNGNFHYGTYNIGSERISKYNLLKKVMNIYEHFPEINKEPNPKVDLSFSSNKFIKQFNIKIASIDDQLSEVSTIYDQYK